MEIITISGTSVKFDDGLVILDHPDAPDDMRDKVAGRIVHMGGRSGFQPVSFAEFAMKPEVLRAIAELIEKDN